MKYQKAKQLLQEDIQLMNQEELQKYKVRIIDAWRIARGDYGFENDFFAYVAELKGYVPRDYWLLKNIENRMNELGL